MDAIESQNARKSISLAEVLNTNPNCVPPPLNVGDKIIWLSDNGTEEGIVKWLGILPDVGKDWMAGVQFKNPVGSGTGLYNNQQLFVAPMNHASLVPVIGLIKSEDFLDDQNNAPKKPLRKKKIDPDDPNIQRALQANSYLINKENNSSSSPINSSKSTKKLNEKKQAKLQRNYELLPELMAQQCDTKQDNKKLDKEQAEEEFEVGTMVEIEIDGQSLYGVIKWIGYVQGFDQPIAGLELEEEIQNGGDGMFANKRYFTCSSRRSIFRPLIALKKDSRFTSNDNSQTDDYSNHNSSNLNDNSNMFNLNTNNNSNGENFRNDEDNDNFSEVDGLFGPSTCPRVEGNIPPLTGSQAIKNLCGKNRGIQGHHNSCYMDATLFAMFTCSSTFESLLQRPPSRNDIPEYSEVQLVLKEDIVNPLRQNYYVRADRVMKLRKLLEKISTVRGLTSEEKDTEEFINLLLGEIFKVEPFLKLSSGLESYLYQLFVEKDEQLVLPTVQQLFDQSFLTSDIKLNEIPNCLILQLPRYGKQFKMYNRVIPSLHLDITDVLDNSPRQCAICGQCAHLECKECFSSFTEGLQSTAFCFTCSNKLHSISGLRANHKITKLNVPIEFLEFAKKRNSSQQRMDKKFSIPIERVYMDLFAILCIETSHYVCFVKCGTGPDAPWCFFDSMADRKGEQNGYNIPEVISFPDLKWWLSEEGTNYLLTIKDDKLLPEMPRRLLCDAYMCLYQSKDVSLYK